MTVVALVRGAWFLHQKDESVSIVLPNKAKKYKEALGLKSKNDRIDAKGLAQMACEQSFNVWKPLTNSLYMLRMVTRQIQRVAEQKTVVRNQLHALEHGMHRDLAIESMQLEQLESLEKNKKSLELRVKSIVEEDEILKLKFEKICKIKGLGLLSLASIVAETNGFAAFENAAQLVSYAGYDVVENQSGNKNGKTKISKRGNSHIRRSLHFPAFNMITYKIKVFENLYERVYEKTRIKMKAYTAVQKKLLVVIYSLWKKDEAFEIDYQDKNSQEIEPELSLASVSTKPEKKEIKAVKKIQKKEKITLAKAKVTQDKHPSKNRRMLSLAKCKSS